MKRFALILVVLLVVAGAVGFVVRSRGKVVALADPPARPVDLVTDPVISKLIDEAFGAVVRKPYDPERRLKLGMIYESNKLPELAVTCYEQFVTLDPENAKGWFHLATAREEIGEVASAVATMDRSIALKGDYAPSHWRKGLWLLELGRVDEAVMACEVAVRIAPEDVYAKMAMARSLMRADRSSDAVEILEEVVRGRADWGYAWQLLGTAYRFSHRAEDAKAAFAKSIGAEPEWIDGWYGDILQYRAGYIDVVRRALKCYARGEYEEMLGLLLPLRSHRPDDVALLNNVGQAYLALGRFRKAADVYGEAIRKHPDHYGAYMNMASLHYRTKQPARALTFLNKSIELNQGVSKAHEMRGMILWGQGLFEPALASMDCAYGLDARNPDLLVWRGMLQCELKRFSDAVDTFEQAVEMDGAPAGAYIGLGLARMELGAFDASEDALDRGALQEPGNPQLRTARERLKVLRGLVNDEGEREVETNDTGTLEQG